jgi:hypothetical protein
MQDSPVDILPNLKDWDSGINTDRREIPVLRLLLHKTMPDLVNFTSLIPLGNT